MTAHLPRQPRLAPAAGADIRVRDVAIGEGALTVALMDGRTIAAPLAWYPRLAGGTAEQRACWQLATCAMLRRHFANRPVSDVMEIKPGKPACSA